MSGENSAVCQLGAEEECILASFTQSLIKIAAVACARTSATEVLNAMRLPAISIDRRGFIVDVNAAADAVFDSDIKIKDKRLFLRDLEARAILKASLNALTNPANLKSLLAEPIVVQRRQKFPVILRIWPSEWPTHSFEQEVHALVTLNALGPKPGPPAAILAKTFRLTASEAKLACVIARGAPLQIAARELEIPWETARKRLKSVFAKTYTHRQSELVALLLQVE
jgi:DNA-binding CsgD family transcriptional regulator